MKTGKLVENRHNRNVFSYNNNIYKYDDIYNLIKNLTYHTSGKHCDWTIIRVHDLLSNKDCYGLFFQETTSKEDIWHDAVYYAPLPPSGSLPPPP